MRRARPGWTSLVLIGLLVAASAQAAEPLSWLQKIHPRVLDELSAEGATEVLIVLREQADVDEARLLDTKLERGRRVHERLTDVATRTQAPLIAFLEQRGVPHRAFWVVNMIWARADLDTIATLAARADVERVDANPQVGFHEPIDAGAADSSATPQAIEWGVLKLRADQLWAMGYDGSGVVVGGQDTGYEWDHPALIDHYRGWDGSSATHDYNWHDAIHTSGGSCSPDSPFPCDDFGHGTHTMGTMVGDDGGANRIGVAPGAEWIACRNMKQGNGTAATYTECFEFFIAPTDLAGNSPDPSKSPHVINNSWLCPESEGCSWDTLQTVVENTRAAGIVVVASAGNDGSGCETINAPPALYDSAFSVGATDSGDNIAGFSSRGPVTIDGSNRLKPDVSAPGVSVRSCVPGGGYNWFSGTSMAGPHVAGLVALLLDARPDLIGRVEEVEEILRLTAVPRTTGQQCGGIPGSEIPNPVYGYGRVDALDAVAGDADGDGVSTLVDCAPANGAVWDPPGPALELRVEINNLVTGIFWNAPTEGSAAGQYDVVRATSPSDFSSAECLAVNTVQTASFDHETPASVFYYLVRAENECGGNLGVGSSGQPRSAGPCPENP